MCRLVCFCFCLQFRWKGNFFLTLFVARLSLRHFPFVPTFLWLVRRIGEEEKVRSTKIGTERCYVEKSQLIRRLRTIFLFCCIWKQAPTEHKGTGTIRVHDISKVSQCKAHMSNAPQEPTITTFKQTDPGYLRRKLDSRQNEKSFRHNLHLVSPEGTVTSYLARSTFERRVGCCNRQCLALLNCISILFPFNFVPPPSCNYGTHHFLSSYNVSWRKSSAQIAESKCQYYSTLQYKA